MSPKRPFNIMLESDQIEFLRLLGKATGSSPSELIRQAIQAYVGEAVQRLGPEVREELERRQRRAIKKKLRE